MAEENVRPSRGRKKDAAADAAGKAKKTTAAKATGKKPTAKRATGTRAARPTLVAEPSRDAIAERAYHLWERGEPGDQTEHWLRAEAELRAA
jgi:Protein of unknown function (DUF2934)